MHGFSIGDLVIEKRFNFWYFSHPGIYGYEPHASSEYWDEYNIRYKNAKPLIGIVIEIVKNDANDYYAERYTTYKVMWLSLSEQEHFLKDRYFFSDELRLLSKINHSQEEDTNG